MPRTATSFVLAIVAFLVVFTLLNFRSSDQFLTPQLENEILQGSLSQTSAKSKPPAIIVSENKDLLTQPEPVGRQRFPQEFKTFKVPDDIVYPKDGPQPDQVAMLMASDGQGHNSQIPHLFERAMENRKQYAELHGYHFHFINTTRYILEGAHPVWSKLPAIVDTFNRFPSAQWVWWLDSDAIIMTPQINLISHLLSSTAMNARIEKNLQLNAGGNTKSNVYTTSSPDVSQIDIIVSQDHNGLNAGSFFIRRSTTARWILDMWADPEFINAGWYGQEQETLLRMVLNHKSVRDHVGYVPQRVINAYPVGDENMGWFSGDLVVHFAGCWVESGCERQFEEYWSKRKTVEGVEGV